ncbi:MAG: CvpA family protein [Saprospiraceae bacterium]
MPIDLICLIVFAVAFWIGYQRGIIQLIFNLVAYIFGVTLAFKMTPITTSALEAAFNSTNPLMFLAGFLVNIAIVMIVVRYAARGMEGLFNIAYMGVFNQLLGGVAYGGFAVLLLSVLVWFADKALMIDEETKRVSKTYEHLVKMPPRAKDLAVRMQPVFADIWDTSVTWMDRLKNYGPDKKEAKPKFYDIEDDGSKGGGIEDYPAEAKPKAKPARPPADDGNGIEGE